MCSLFYYSDVTAKFEGFFFLFYHCDVTVKSAAFLTTLR